MSFGELMSIIYLLLLSRKRYSFTPLKNINKQNLIMKDLLNISLPLTGSRLYHCFMNFLEPIFLIHVLTRLGLTQNFIQDQYAILSGYVVSMLVTPTFFCTILHLLYALLICFLIGLPFTLIFYFFPKRSLMILYNTTSGYQQLKYMSFPFLLFYLQTPLSTILQAKNKNKVMFIISMIECSLEIILTYTLSHYL